LLTSKEIIERTGISRATLNNYIASALVPRPQVLPPGPEHGDAPRIGYFPDDTIERIETIQRLKREGWSITRIAERFAQARSGAAAPNAGTPAFPPSPAVQPAARNVIATGLALTPADAIHPAYLVDDAFRLVWMNEPARSSPSSPLRQRHAAGSVFEHLLQVDQARGRDLLLHFHLEAARARGLAAGVLFEAVAPQVARSLQATYSAISRPAALPLVAQSLLPRAGGLPPRWIYAVHFHQGVLFAVSDTESESAAPAPDATLRTAPALTPVAVLVGVLQDAADLWVRLSAEEYFELLNDVGDTLDALWRQHDGRPGRPAGEALVCYFLPQAQGSHLWNALAAAHGGRELMRQVSQRWRVRKGWDVELRLNIGIDEGQDWLGTLGAGGQGELRVLGDAADRAAHLSRCSRMGAILLTRNLAGKLTREQRQQLTYGVPRLDGLHAEAPLLFTFARLGDLAAPGTAPPAVADLAVAELLALNSPVSHPHGSTR
jgi:adenylate cyclase